MSSTPGCVAHAGLFHSLEDVTLPGDDAGLRRQAAAVCAACPMAAQCLYEAIVHHDVSGFVAGTTPQQRRQIRARVGVRIESENLDTAAGVIAGGRPVDRAEVMRLRRVNPDDTLDQLALRLGCSTSTVKRHLRHLRTDVADVRPARRVPSVAEVLDAARAVLGRRLAPAA